MVGVRSFLTVVVAGALACGCGQTSAARVGATNAGGSGGVTGASAAGTGGAQAAGAGGGTGGGAGGNVAGAAGVAGTTGGVSGGNGAGGVSGGGAGVGGIGGIGGSAGSGGVGGGSSVGGYAGGTIVHQSEGPSCAGGLTCSADGRSCCENTLVPSGTFHFDRADKMMVPPQYVFVDALVIDTYLVSVSRFRAFATAYDTLTKPIDGAGANPAVPCEDVDCVNYPGNSGWRSFWNQYLPATSADLRASVASCGALSTWTDTAGEDESRPINCVDWFEAYAFCIWDGGRLPFAAEWSYVAAGGAEHRTYPWGPSLPDATRVGPNCDEDCGGTCKGCGQNCSSAADIPLVGSFPAGSGKWGHLDLRGSLYQQARDMVELFVSTSGYTCEGRPECCGLDLSYEGGAISWALPIRFGGGSTCAAKDCGINQWADATTVEHRPTFGVRCVRQPQ